MNRNQQDFKVNGWMTIANARDVEMQTPRGRLFASAYDAIHDEGMTKWAMVLHGACENGHEQVLDIACELSLKGYHVLLPDAYAYGKSEGIYTSLGIREAEDICYWAEWILSQDHNASIVILGIDEGAAAAIMALDHGLPDAVCAIAADSAYINVKQHAEAKLENRFGQIGHLDWLLFSCAYRIVFGADMDRGELMECVSSADIPFLFIHGTGDHEVPAWHSEELALSAGENAGLLYIEGASHGMARFADQQRYYDALLRFFEYAQSE